MTMQRHKQPELMNEWGTRFYGKAETDTGDVWWYVQDGKKIPLMPVNPIAGEYAGSGGKDG